MECQWYNRERVLFQKGHVIADVVEQGLFVGEVEIVLEVVVHENVLYVGVVYCRECLGEETVLEHVDKGVFLAQETQGLSDHGTHGFREQLTDLLPQPFLLALLVQVYVEVHRCLFSPDHLLAVDYLAVLFFDLGQHLVVSALAPEEVERV